MNSVAALSSPISEMYWGRVSSMDATLHTSRVGLQGGHPHNSFMAARTAGREDAFVGREGDVDLKKEVGRRIRLARRTVRNPDGSVGLSLTGLERATGNVLSASRISNYEQGLRLPRTREAQILGKALDVDPAYLLCLEGEDMQPEEVELLRNYRALPEKDRKEYSRRIGAMALMYREPVADERLGAFAKKPKKKRQVAE